MFKPFHGERATSWSISAASSSATARTGTASVASRTKMRTRCIGTVLLPAEVGGRQSRQYMAVRAAGDTPAGARCTSAIGPALGPLAGIRPQPAPSRSATAEHHCALHLFRPRENRMRTRTGRLRTRWNAARELENGEPKARASLGLVALVVTLIFGVPAAARAGRVVDIAAGEFHTCA